MTFQYYWISTEVDLSLNEDMRESCGNSSICQVISQDLLQSSNYTIIKLLPTSRQNTSSTMEQLTHSDEIKSLSLTNEVCPRKVRLLNICKSLRDNYS